MSEKEILLVEDNEGDVFLTKRALNIAKIRNNLAVASDGVEAIEYLLGNPTKPSTETKLCPVLILLDLNLPKIDGLQVLKQIRKDERTCMCPVVILTSSREEIDIIRGYKLGANSYICKPVDFSQFVETLRQLALYWLVLNEPPPPTNIG